MQAGSKPGSKEDRQRDECEISKIPNQDFK